MTTTTWTDAASEHLDQYLRQLRSTLAGSGADPDEVIDDLRRHIDQSLVEAGVGVVTQDELARILSRIGPPQAAPAAAPVPVTAPPAQAAPPSRLRFHPPHRPAPMRSAGILLGGVLLPCLAVVLEWFGGICASIYVNPLPSLAFVGLILLAPLANLLVFFTDEAASSRWKLLLGLLNGAAIAISLAYALLFLPLTPVAVLAIVAMGIGLLPLSPLFAFLAALECRRRLRLMAGGQAAPGLWRGALLGGAGLALAALPVVATSLAFEIATSDSAATRMAGIRLLRQIGSRQRMLELCQTPPTHHAERAQRIFYQVTGDDPTVALSGRPRNREWLDDQDNWDDRDDRLQGSTQIGGILPGLSLLDSRIDGFIEPDAAFGYMEWTLNFNNDSGLTREARALIALPPGGVVSRLTLWINGQECEAAFGGRSQVRQAYQSVAIVQRRDPVLVTTAGPDRITLQCFPILPRGQMKTRIGITFPLELPSAGETVARMPRLLEQNFHIRPQLEHAVWLESPTPASDTTGQLKSDKPAQKAHALRGGVAHAQLPRLTIAAGRTTGATTAWARGSAPGASHYVTQRIEPATSPAPQRIVLVVNGSRQMGRAIERIGQALTGIADGVEVAVIVAGDERIELAATPQAATPQVLASLADRLASIHPAGGVDSLPALCRGWDLAAEVEQGLLVWLHGAQPVLIESVEPLRQRWDRHRGRPRMLAVQMTPGRNVILNELDGVPEVSTVALFTETAEDLKRILASASTAAPRLVATRSRVEERPGEGAESSPHLTRLWAADEVQRLISKRVPALREQAMALAVQHQLVTPVSGAVVLETAAQYAAHELKPADPATVPMVPEPGSVAMLLTAGTLLLLRRRRVVRG